MNFNNRTSYLSWTSEWKSSYRAASLALRKLKLDFKQAQRENAWAAESKLRSEIRAAKNNANQMLEERQASKIEAQRQFLAERAARTAA